MPQGPGEDLLLTVFADVHYFFGSQHEKPAHHRFDKGSYVYLYRNTAQSRGRLEVANNAGTPEQDAFSGYIDSTYTQYSHKHSALASMTVDGASLTYGAPPSLPNDLSQWYLPAFDPRNEGKYMFRLHTIDFYFWKAEDALLFLHSVGTLLPPAQVRILDPPAPPSAHVDVMSPVVQKLETAAITDASYVQHRESGSQSATSAHAPPLGRATSFVAPVTTTTAPGARNSKPEELPGDYVPLTYNPAAPAAPETIAHRDKTPPPAEAAGGTGLAAVAYESSPPHFTPAPLQYQKPVPPLPPSAVGHPPAPQPSYLPSPPQPQPQAASPHPHPQRQASIPGPPHSPQPPPRSGSHHSSRNVSAAPSRNNSFAPPPTVSRHGSTSDPHNAHRYPHASPHSQHVQPGAAFSPSPTQTPPAGAGAGAPVAPAGGYSTFQYTQTAPPPPMLDAHGTHGQVYRPTEQEASAHKYAPGQAGPTGKLDKVEKGVEKRVGGFLKKLEKRIG